MQMQKANFYQLKIKKIFLLIEFLSIFEGVPYFGGWRARNTSGFFIGDREESVWITCIWVTVSVPDQQFPWLGLSERHHTCGNERSPRTQCCTSSILVYPKFKFFFFSSALKFFVSQVFALTGCPQDHEAVFIKKT